MNNVRLSLIALALFFLLNCKVTSTTSTPDRTIVYAGAGTSIDKPIVIKYAKNSAAWLQAEQDYLTTVSARKQEEWKLQSRKMIANSAQNLDELTVEVLGTDSVFQLYFQIMFYQE